MNLLKKRSIFLSAFFIVFLFGCRNNYDFTYDIIVTDTPVNLESINSIYDDYNSDLPYDYDVDEIYFSSNRNSAGGNFDIINKQLSSSYHSRDDVVDFSFEPFDLFGLEPVLNVINKNHNELGPYTYSGEDGYSYFFYANDSLGDFDIRYVAYRNNDPNDHFESKPFNSLNSDSDDLYPTISEDVIYLCSNRESDVFNIYTAPFIEGEISPLEEEEVSPSVELNTILSSNKNDKCPSFHKFYDDLVIFTSDRDGGYGGYDLYYSKKINGDWTSPINCGAKINSEYDEYRPIMVSYLDKIHEDYNERVIIFSSDRPGGLGGFDLYAVRMPIE